MAGASLSAEELREDGCWGIGCGSEGGRIGWKVGPELDMADGNGE